MRVRISLVLFVIIAGLFTQNLLAQQFTPPNEGFTVWLNGKPTPQTRTGDTSFGKLTIKVYLVNGQNGAHGVSVNQYPFATEEPAAIEKSLDAGIASLISGRKAKKISEKSVTLGGHNGKEVYFSFAGGVGKVKVFLVKYNLYQIIALGTSPFVNSASTKKVFDSFNFTEGNVGEKWTTFTSNASGFALLFPSKPQVQTKKIGVDGVKSLFQYTISVASQSEEYGIIVTDISKEVLGLPKADILEFLRGSTESSVKEKPRTIAVGDEQGIEYYLDIESGKTKVWSLVKNGKSYQIFLRGSDEKHASAEAKSFFDSFKFVKPAPTKAKGK